MAEARQLSFATCCAMLEDAGYRRDEIRGLSRRYVARVLQHRRDREGKLVPAYAGGGPPPRAGTYLDRCRAALRARNYPPWAVEGKAREWDAAERARRAAKAGRRARPGK